MVTEGMDRIVVEVDPLIQDLASQYLVNRLREIDKIGSALARGDFDTIRIIGHNMQGSGGSFGFDYVSVVGGDLERAASVADGGDIAYILERLAEYLSHVDVVVEGRGAGQPGAIAAYDGAGRRTAPGEAQILVVDDQEMNAAIIGRYLSREGFAIRHVTSGDEALALLEGGTLPALILLDVVMPGTNGFEVCRRIKANSATRFIPVMLVTSLDGGNDRIRGWAAGADDMLPRPVRRQELVTRIRALVRTLMPEADARCAPENGAALRPA